MPGEARATGTVAAPSASGDAFGTTGASGGADAPAASAGSPAPVPFPAAAAVHAPVPFGAAAEGKAISAPKDDGEEGKARVCDGGGGTAQPKLRLDAGPSGQHPILAEIKAPQQLDDSEASTTAGEAPAGAGGAAGGMPQQRRRVAEDEAAEEVEEAEGDIGGVGIEDLVAEATGDGDDGRPLLRRSVRGRVGGLAGVDADANEDGDGADADEDEGDQELLAAVNAFATPNSTRHTLVDLLFPHESASDGTSLAARRSAVVAPLLALSFTEARARRLFGALLPGVRAVADDVEFEDEDMNAEDGEGGWDKKRAVSSVRFLRCASILVMGYLDGLLSRSRRGRPDAVDEALNVAEELHGQLFSLQSAADGFDVLKREASAAQSAVIEICERWWRADLDGKEKLVTQLIPLLLLKSLDVNAQGDLKRLYSMRHAIDVLDFEDESIRSLKHHLLRTVGNTLFLESAEGRKFVAHLFGVDASLGRELHMEMWNRIPLLKDCFLDSYAKIYFAAWKGIADAEERDEEGKDAQGDADGEDDEDKDDNNDDEEKDDNNDDDDDDASGGDASARSAFEEDILQNLACELLHSTDPRPWRAVLDEFYVRKEDPSVESLLRRTYCPLLWQALASADARNRRRAAEALADTFPLYVSKSVKALEGLMKDEVPSVQVEGIRATTKILESFWNLVPEEDVRTLLNREFVCCDCPLCFFVHHASDLVLIQTSSPSTPPTSRPRPPSTP